MKKLFDEHKVPEAVAYVENVIEHCGDKFGINLDIQIVKFLRAASVRIEGMILNEAIIVIPKQGLAGLLASVRSRLLDFLLELREKYPELDGNEEATGRLSESEIDSVVACEVFKDCTFIERNEMRDNYSAGQAGNMGPSAKIENMNFIQILRETIGETSLTDLANELETLRKVMLSDAKSQEQDVAVSAVAQAEEAAKKGDAKGVLGFLGQAGKWAFDVANKIGTTVAAKVIEKSMGL